MQLKAFTTPPGSLSQRWTVSAHGKRFLTSKLNLRAAPDALSFLPWPLGRGEQTPHNGFVHVWQLLSSLPSRLPARSWTRQDVFNSDPLLCVAVVRPQAGVTFNHPVFRWAEARESPEGLHAGQSSFWKVVTGNLFLGKVIWPYCTQITEIFFKDYSTALKWPILGKSTLTVIDCKSFIAFCLYTALSSVPPHDLSISEKRSLLKKMPDLNHRRNSWNQQKINPKEDWSIAIRLQYKQHIFRSRQC